jgi:hypothetical protein
MLMLLRAVELTDRKHYACWQRCSFWLTNSLRTPVPRVQPHDQPRLLRARRRRRSTAAASECDRGAWMPRRPPAPVPAPRLASSRGPLEAQAVQAIMLRGSRGRSGPFPLEQARGPGPLFRRPFIDAISRRLRGGADARAERGMRQVSRPRVRWRGNGQVPQQRRRPGRRSIRAATGATPAGADVTMRRDQRRSARRSSAAALRGAVAAAAPRGSLGHFPLGQTRGSGPLARPSSHQGMFAAVGSGSGPGAT